MCPVPGMRKLRQANRGKLDERGAARDVLVQPRRRMDKLLAAAAPSEDAATNVLLG